MRPVSAVHDDPDERHEFRQLYFAGRLWQRNGQNEALAFTDMIGIRNKPSQPLQDQFHRVAVAGCAFGMAGDMSYCFSVVSFIRHKRSGEFSVCSSTFPALKNAQLVVFCDPRRVYCMPPASPSGEQLSLALGTWNDLLGNDDAHFTLAFPPEMC